MKRISPATVTFGVMAIVLGLVAAYIVRQALQQAARGRKRPAPPRPPAGDGAGGLCRREHSQAHAARRAGDVFVSQVPKGAKLPTGTFRGVTAGRRPHHQADTIRAGQAIRDEYLLGIDEALPDLADRLPAGHRAVTIVVQGADTGGKRLAEGDHVDLAMTVEGTHPDLGEVMTRTLMRNVLVVDAAAGRPLVRGPRRKTNELSGSTITVAVAPADANKLIVAERTGTLHRHAGQRQDIDAATAARRTTSITRRQLLGLKEIRAAEEVHRREVVRRRACRSSK